MTFTGLPQKQRELESARVEEARIREAYSKRKSFVSPDLYSHSNPGNLFIIQDRERQVLESLARYRFSLLDTKQVLEIGCGTGSWIRDLIRWGAQPQNIVGIDLLPDRIAEAKRLCPEGVTVHCGSATNLGFADHTFDLVLQSTVFTSILDPGMKQQIASEMIRLVKPDGLILWYDYHVNNPRNPDVRGVRRREIFQLFSGCRIELHRITLAPPLTRLIAPYSWLACTLLSKIPFLCTHYLGVIRKEGGV